MKEVDFPDRLGVADAAMAVFRYVQSPGNHAGKHCAGEWDGDATFAVPPGRNRTSGAPYLSGDFGGTQCTTNASENSLGSVHWARKSAAGDDT